MHADEVRERQFFLRTDVAQRSRLPKQSIGSKQSRERVKRLNRATLRFILSIGRHVDQLHRLMVERVGVLHLGREQFRLFDHLTVVVERVLSRRCLVDLARCCRRRRCAFGEQLWLGFLQRLIQLLDHVGQFSRRWIRTVLLPVLLVQTDADLFQDALQIGIVVVVVVVVVLLVDLRVLQLLLDPVLDNQVLQRFVELVDVVLDGRVSWFLVERGVTVTLGWNGWRSIRIIGLLGWVGHTC